MELTSAHLEAIKEAARAVEYGSVTLTISANAKTLDLIVENRVRIKKEPGGEDAAEGEEGQGSDGNSDAPVGEDDGSGKQK
ncbi:MAG: hypothetical protein LBF78_06460, partial [Treponema sp.]|nr:hypothetical protein [Treponema sp.]